MVGPDRHGVVSHGLRLAAADPRLSSSLLRWSTASSGIRPQGLVEAIPAGCAVLLQATDRLLGSTPEEAAELVGRLADRTRLVVGLHDVPQPAEGRSWYERRRRTYAAMAQAVSLVVVASVHEREALLRCLPDAAARSGVKSRIAVVPLPVQAPAADPPVHPVSPGEVGVLGFLYPGKGVEDVIDAAATLRREGRAVRVSCLGATAEGHADHAEELGRRAARAGVPFRVSGYIPNSELAGRLRGVAVPVAPHRHISASGSINAWLEADRRPVALPSPYARELADRIPGAVELTTDLTDGIRVSLDDPRRTWLRPGTQLGPTVAEAARRHADLLDEACWDGRDRAPAMGTTSA